MNCHDIQQLISAKLDEELTPEEEQILSEHMPYCYNCSAFAKKLEELKVLSSNWQEVQIPAELERQILSKTVKPVKKEIAFWSFLSGYYRVPRSLAWASVLLFLIFLVNSILSPVKTLTKSENRVQKIVLSETDIVKTYTIIGKKNF